MFGQLLLCQCIDFVLKVQVHSPGISWADQNKASEVVIH